MFGRMLKQMRHAWVIFGVMMSMLVVLIGLGGVLGHAAPESGPDGACRGHCRTAAVAGCRWTKAWATWRARNCVSALPPAPTFAAGTTAIACGSVNCAHDSLNPLAGLTPLIGMWLNCIFGGKGVGMINLLLYLIVGVFIAGLMVGRTPEYLGKKVEAREMKLAMLALLVHPILILMPTGLFAATDWGMKSDEQPRRARLLGNGLRVQFRLGQQRLGVRRAQHGLGQ